MPVKKTVTDNRITPRNEDNTFNGTRKLIRPHLPPVERRREAFYFQKQMQQQTEMTVVLEDGEHINGFIQWYDKCVVKLQVGRSRVLVYKPCIKYLYKASEGHPAGSVMK
jgi:RNA chaperone Hfq